ncbi:tRNA pseudouridine synthase 1 [Entophlyctis luteolus]|nr:tRNA pseudouridine synthase 1 [Entophlyctis luteolus]
MKIAVLFGAAASAVAPDLRVLSAVAALCPRDDRGSDFLRFAAVSRSADCDPGEFAHRLVLSLDLNADPLVSITANSLNARLPQSVRVYSVVRVPRGFSARRMCGGFTYECLLPTYVFAPPPPQTGFPFADEPVDMTDILQVNHFEATLSRLRSSMSRPKHSDDPNTRKDSIRRKKKFWSSSDVDFFLANSDVPSPAPRFSLASLKRNIKSGDSFRIPTSDSIRRSSTTEPASLPDVQSIKSKCVESHFVATVKGIFRKLKRKSIPLLRRKSTKASTKSEPDDNLQSNVTTVSTARTPSPPIDNISPDILPDPKCACISATRNKRNARISRSSSAFPDDDDDEQGFQTDPTSTDLVIKTVAIETKVHYRGPSESELKTRFSNLSAIKRLPVFGDDEDDEEPVYLSSNNGEHVAGEDQSYPAAAIVSKSAEPTSLPAESQQAFELPPRIHLNPTTEEDKVQLKQYRVTAKQLASVRAILNQYRGTHDFHNYARGANDEPVEGPLYARILNTECADPSVTHAGMEWIRIRIATPAPLAHMQLRAMLAMLVLVVRTNTPLSVIAGSFGRTRIPNLPVAPVAGCGIADVDYSAWNYGLKLSTSTERGDGDGLIHADGVIDFGELMPDLKQYVEGFVEGSVRDEVYIEEEDAMVYEAWLKEIDACAHSFTNFLNPRGIVSGRHCEEK